MDTLKTQPKFFDISYNEYSETYSTLGDFRIEDKKDGRDIACLNVDTFLELIKQLERGFSRIKELPPALIWSRKVGYDADHGDELVLEILIEREEGVLFLSRRSKSKKAKFTSGDEECLRQVLKQVLYDWYFRTLPDKPTRVWKCKQHQSNK